MPEADELTKLIQKLSDAAAVGVLRAIVEGVGAPPPTDETAEAAAALAAAEPGATPGDGEAARLALRLLADDPAYAVQVRALVTNPPARLLAADPITIALLSAGVTFALKTHIRIEKLPSGKWIFKLEKRPVSDGLIGPLIKKLAALLK